MCKKLLVQRHHPYIDDIIEISLFKHINKFAFAPSGLLDISDILNRALPLSVQNNFYPRIAVWN
jgi:hypothetical protein